MFGISPNGNNFDDNMMATEVVKDNMSVNADDMAIRDDKLKSDSTETMEIFNNEEVPENIGVNGQDGAEVQPIRGQP
jgi:hypothetical protein